MKGKVCIVGAGPGDPELLTMRAVNRLRSADVVLHDALISPQILALISPAARILEVGKRCGAKKITQEEINSLLVSFASGGSAVVRLKSGDPLLFGRAGEELDALRAAGVDFEIVPGITSALAGAAAAGISLTDRRYGSQVLLVSAHHADGRADTVWQDLHPAHTTTVVYMPGCHKDIAAGLMQSGLSASTPCVVISRISMPEELAYRTTLGTLANAPVLPAPSLLIVGENATASTLPKFQSPLCSQTASGN